MKKQNIFFAVTFAAIMILTACNGGGNTKDPKLATEIDSLNYTYGLAFGNDLKTNLFNKDSVEQKTKSFMKGLAEGAKGEADTKPAKKITNTRITRATIKISGNNEKSIILFPFKKIY